MTTTATDPDFTPNIPAFVRAIAARFGNLPAFERDGRAWTYAELDARSRHVAANLLRAGVGKGSRVAVLMSPRPEFVAALLGIGRAGAVAVPVSTLAQGPELQWLLRKAEIEHLVCEPRFLRHDYVQRLEDHIAGLKDGKAGDLALPGAPRLRAVHVLGEDLPGWALPGEALFAAPDQAWLDMADAVEALVCPGDPFVIVHTSGSTAEPKGVIHGHGPLIRHSWRMAHNCFAFGEGDRLASPRPMFWVAGLVATLFYGLQRGCCILSISDESPAAITRMLSDDGLAGLVGTTGWFDGVRGSGEFVATGGDLVQLTVDTAAFVQDGAYVSPTVAALLGAPRHVPVARIAHSFGMTEFLGAHTSLPVAELLPENRPYWQGRPVPGVEIKVVDPETRARLPDGEVGELCVRGYSMMLGMNGREWADIVDAEGFYATGDLCRADATGLLKFEGRRGEMVKIHGANVSPLQVELAMTGQHGVARVCVVGIGSDAETRLAAVVSMAPGVALDEDGLRAFLKTQLSSFMVPAHIVALSDDEMPTTSSGKIRRDKARALLEERLLR